MKIRSHPESHLVELEDGSRWQIFPGDLDLTLDWTPDTDLVIAEAAKDDVGSHLLVGVGEKVRVIPEGESWPIREAKDVLKDAELLRIRRSRRRQWWAASPSAGRLPGRHERRACSGDRTAWPIRAVYAW